VYDYCQVWNSDTGRSIYTQLLLAYDVAVNSEKNYFYFTTVEGEYYVKISTDKINVMAI
jgi:hypothetical protein